MDEQLTPHGNERLFSRLQMSGVPSAQIAYLATALADFAKKQKADTAVRVTVLSKQEVTHGTSNGEEVWAIIRGGSVVTVMNRRGTQPKTPQALRVDKVFLSIK